MVNLLQSKYQIHQVLDDLTLTINQIKGEQGKERGMGRLPASARGGRRKEMLELQ